MDRLSARSRAPQILRSVAESLTTVHDFKNRKITDYLSRNRAQFAITEPLLKTMHMQAIAINFRKF